MNKQLIRDLAITGGIYDCICDPYDKLENGDYYSSIMVDLERFAEKIVKECMAIADEQKKYVEDMEVFNEQDATWNKARIQQSQQIVDKIKQHFGVEE
jgi:hypothetical protein